MDLYELLHTCFVNIFRNRMRSLLTSLGVIIGVGSVIVMVAVGGGAQKEIEKQISSMGTNLVQIMPKRMFNRLGQSGAQSRSNKITLEDARTMRDESSYSMAVSGVYQRSFTVIGSAGSASVQVMGVEPDYLTIRDWPVQAGTFFGQEDLDTRNRVAVLGATTADSLFGSADSALGAQIRIGTNNFTVTGILAKKGVGMNGADQDDIVMVPLDTALTRLGNTKNLSSIAISVAGKEYMDAARREAEQILRETHKLRFNADNDFDIMNSADIIDMASQTSRSLTILLAAIAGVSLVVGGIGIMNIMLVSVTERTREIGIRMSVGARKRDILLQFLTESIALSLMGGIIGIALSFLTCRLLTVFGIPTSINPLIIAVSALFAALVGIFFGYYPAKKAAGLYPIDALRYE